MIHTPNPPQPSHDPIAEILGDDEEHSDKKLDRAANTADRDRFMKAVQTTTRILNTHPNTQEFLDASGKPITKAVDDEVELPEGSVHVWLKAGPSTNKRHLGQPVITVTTLDRYDTMYGWADTDPESGEPTQREIAGARATSLEFFSDGTIGIGYADTIEQLDRDPYDPLTEGDYPLGGRADWFEMHVDNLVKESDPHITDKNYNDWEHVEHIEQVVEALEMKL